MGVCFLNFLGMELETGEWNLKDQWETGRPVVILSAFMTGVSYRFPEIVF